MFFSEKREMKLIKKMISGIPNWLIMENLLISLIQKDIAIKNLMRNQILLWLLSDAATCLELGCHKK